MTHPYDRPDVRAGSVRARADDQCTGNIRILLPYRAYLVRRRRLREVHILVPAWRNQPGCHAAEDKSGDYGFVRIPGYE